MKDPFKKAVCLVLSVLLSVPVLAGCRPKVIDDGSVISADTPWYDCTTVMLEDGYDRFGYGMLESRVLGVIGDQILAVTTGDRRTPPTETDPDMDTKLKYYDMDGNLTEVVDLYEKIASYAPPEEFGEIFFGSIYNIDLFGDKVYVKAYSRAYNDYFTFVFDTQSREFVSHEISDSSSYYFFEGYRNYDGYKVRPGMDWSVIVYEVVAPDGTVTYLSTSGLISHDIYEVFNMIYLGDGMLLSYVLLDDMSTYKVILDLDSGTLSTLEGNNTYDWLDAYGEDHFGYFDGVGNVIVDGFGISRLDLENKTSERIITYDECNINRVDMNQMELLYMDDQNIIFSGIVMRGGYMDPGDSIGYNIEMANGEMIILSRAQTNPNVGKTILRAAYINGRMSYATAEAIRLFNEQSDDAMIVSDLRYTEDALADQVANDIGDTESDRERKLNAAFITTISLDLLAGEGPDLLFGTIENTQLNSPELLIDLKDCINREECFTNVIDSAMTGDALYQLPLCFSVDGILTKTENAPGNEAGFTFDEYVEFVGGPCNGHEPTDLGQVEFFNLCLQQMSDQFYSNGRYDFDNDSFRQLAQFTSEHIFDHDPTIPDILDTSVPKASYVRVVSAQSILRNVHGPIEVYSLLGLASVDGRGPLANVRDSVAVSAAARAPEACLQFVSMLTGTELQQCYAHNCAFSINRNTFIEESYDVIREVNRRFDTYYSLYYYARDLDESRIPSERLDEDAFVNTLLAYADSISGIGFIDSPVQIIASEEIQAYFAGQKSLDEVIALIDNRVETYVNERQN
ncbi:MAG: hypothetical protein J5685_10210 [Clostridiales bacterium]|nr:hypothetical protein [Clostridiales bacterium]